MSRFFGRLFSLWNITRTAILVVASVIILILFSTYLFSQSRIAGDAASHILLAVSPILKIGSPYKNLWDIKPPMLPLVLYIWSNLFGFSILSIKIINILIAFLIEIVGYFVYKKVFKTPVLEIIFIFTIIITLSPLLNSIMMPTEILGLLLSLVALLILIGVKKDFLRFYFSGLLFFAASQAKEPFSLTVLAVVPVFAGLLLRNNFFRLFKNIIYFLLGVLSCFLGIYIYLAAVGSVGSYLEVFKFKQVFYPFTFDRLWLNFSPSLFAAERTFIEFSRSFSILSVLVFISFYLVNRFKKLLIFIPRDSRLIIGSLTINDPGKEQKYVVLFYCIGSFLGFGLGAAFGSHYLIQVVFPFYIICGFIASYLFDSAAFLFKKSIHYFLIVAALFCFSIIVFLPKRPYFSYYLRVNFKFVVEDQIYGYEEKVKQLTTPDQCILSVYGWGSGENYLYSERRPCTRFFLPNIVLQDWQKKEYKDSILENPPMAIIYQTVNSDMNIPGFESEVIDISKIVKNCYVRDAQESVIFVPKVRNLRDLKNCVKVNSI